MQGLYFLVGRFGRGGGRRQVGVRGRRQGRGGAWSVVILSGRLIGGHVSWSYSRVRWSYGSFQYKNPILGKQLIKIDNSLILYFYFRGFYIERFPR